MQEMFRKSTLTLPLPSALSVAAGQVTVTSSRKQRITSAQLCLSDTGTGAGATNVNVKVNGTAINAANSLSIAGAAAAKSVTESILGSENTYPEGARVNPGDTITVDIASLPATTSPKAAFVVLDIVELDV